ncbi:TPA: restriction endonuclease [Salmonella enterica subsp. houtenae serovar 43:z4,z32:-]|nr:restriction endonuclease [Salmonella enterica subsp. houtenae serovar 43:z4,z32:-]
MNETVPTSDKERFLELFPYIREYQKLASKYKINDIFQDNGGKYLQLLMILDLTTDGAREGNDAIDAAVNEYEIKTVNIELQHQFTTHHHMNPVIIAKYRKVDWYFAAFKNIELQVIYKLTPDKMEPFYQKWENKWYNDGGKDINNPKISLKYVMDNGEVVWLPEGIDSFIKPKLIRNRSVPINKRKPRANAISSVDE